MFCRYSIWIGETERNTLIEDRAPRLWVGAEVAPVWR